MNNEIIIKELISTMSDAELKALKRRIEMILAGDLTALGINIDEINILEPMEDYLNDKQICGRTKETLKGYRYSLTNFLLATNKPIEYIKADDIRKYLYVVKETKKIEDISLNNIRSRISAFFTWLKNNGYVSINPCANIQPIKCEIKEREPLDTNELNALRKACVTKRDIAMIETFYSTGCRVSELIGLKKEDLDINKGEVHIFGKGRKHRTSFLNKNAINTLNDYFNNRKDKSEYVFVSERAPHGAITARAVEKRIKFLGEKAQIKGGVFPHRIRHTVATDALSNGMPIDQVQVFLGHERIDTTRIYAKTLKNAIKESHMKYIK